MTFLVRWPIVLILLGLVAACVFPALIGTIEAYNLPIDLNLAPAVSENLERWAESTTMPERLLWYAAGVLFFVTAVRLARRTQGFWVWLLGFACYGGRWALGQQQQEGGVGATVSALTPENFTPEALASGGSSAQVTFLAFMLVVGLLILLVDAADRAHWNRQGA